MSATVDFFSGLETTNSDLLGHYSFVFRPSTNKCTDHPVGINTFGKMPSDFAEFLKLPNSKQFTGHCFWKIIRIVISGFRDQFDNY